MGWFDLLVTWPHAVGNGICLTVWGWSREDACNKARSQGYVVLSARFAPSTSTYSS